MDSVDCDIVTIDYNIDSLLKEKASKLVARELFQKRIRNLKAQGDLEAESFRAFLDAYNLKHKALLERERQVKVGMEATLELQRRVQRLLDAMREEIATLKKRQVSCSLTLQQTVLLHIGLDTMQISFSTTMSWSTEKL